MLSLCDVRGVRVLPAGGQGGGGVQALAEAPADGDTVARSDSGRCWHRVRLGALRLSHAAAAGKVPD